MAINANQQRVFEWLNDELGLPVFAEAYKGSAILIEEKSLGYVSFVSHTGRDIMNTLAKTKAGIRTERVQYQHHVDKLHESWLEEWRFSNDFSSDSQDQVHHIPMKVCKQITDLIDDHISGRARSSDADGIFFSTFLDYEDKDKIPRHFLSEWSAAKKWFMGHAHLRENAFSPKTDAELVKHFRCLDGYLHIAASSQFDRLKDLNEILAATNQ